MKILRCYYIAGVISILMCIEPSFAYAKPVIQEGVAYLYDYKKKSKAPLAGVSFTVADAEPTKSNSNGQFTLSFTTLKKGSKITNVRQPFFKGLKVFNKKTVDDWYIVDGKLELIMCDYEEFELVKKTYYEQGRKSAEQKYAKQQRELEEALHQGKLRENEYEQQLQELRESHQHTLDELSNSADAMARIDQSEISRQMQDVLSLYEQGEVDKAMEMLSGLRLAEGLEQSLIRKERSRKAYQKAVQDSVKAVQNIRSAISLYNYIGDTEKAEFLLRTLANRTQTSHDLFVYAHFCQNNYAYRDSAETYYAKVLDTTKESKAWNLNDLYLYATTMNNLSGIYFNRGEHEKATHAIIEGLEGRRQYAKLSLDPNDENHVAWSLVSYADLLIGMGKYEEGEKYLKEADEIYTRIKPTYYHSSGINDWIYGRLYDKFAWLYLKTGRLSESESYYKKSLELYALSVPENPYDHLRSMIHIATWGLLALYEKQCRIDEEERYRFELIDLVRTYSLSDPKVLPVFVNLLYNTSEIFRERGKTDEWINVRLEWFECCLNSILTNKSRAYDVDMNDVILELTNQKRYAECSNICKAHLEFYKKRNPMDDTYKQKIAGELCNLSYYVIFNHDFPLAENYAHESIDVNPDNHVPLTNLAAAVLFQGRYSEAEAIYRQCKAEFKDAMLEDLETFAANGVIPKEREADVERIKKLLQEE